MTNSNTERNSQITSILSLVFSKLYYSLIKYVISDVNWIFLVPCLIKKKKRKNEVSSNSGQKIKKQNYFSFQAHS